MKVYIWVCIFFVALLAMEVLAPLQPTPTYLQQGCGVGDVLVTKASGQVFVCAEADTWKLANK